MIKVYDVTETLFNHNGIKILNPVFAEITKVDNGDYYLEIRDIVENSDYYQKGMILRTTTPWGEQCFRCDNPVKTSSRIDVKAWHISYDAKNYIIKDANIVDRNCNFALNHANTNTDITSPFITMSDISKEVSTRIIRKSLFEVFEWFLEPEKYGGHWARDNYKFEIRQEIGQDRGVVLVDGKNINAISVSEDWNDVVTKILPYTTDGKRSIALEQTYVEVDEQLYDLPYSKVIRFENIYQEDEFETYDDFETATKEWLLNTATDYLQVNKVPKVNYKVEASIDNISDIGDVIYVKHSKCKVDIMTRVISLKYDCIRNKIINVEFGNYKKTLKDLKEVVSGEVLQDAIPLISEQTNHVQNALNQATSNINSLLKESYVVYNGDEILVCDSLPKETAVNVIRVNSAGIGFSQSGINGTFNSAWSIDGTLDMQQINVINLVADMIRGGTLVIGSVNNQSGVLEVRDNTNKLIAKLDREGLVVYATNGDYVILNGEVGFAGYNKDNVKVYYADGEEFRMKNANVENQIKIGGMIKVVPVNSGGNVGVGFVALGG